MAYVTKITAGGVTKDVKDEEHHMGDYRIVRKNVQATYPNLIKAGGTTPRVQIGNWSGDYQLIDKYCNVIDQFTARSIAPQPQGIGNNYVGVIYWDTAATAQAKIKAAATMPEGLRYYPLGWIDIAPDNSGMKGNWIGIDFTYST